MHDIRTIRDNPAAFDAALSRRGIAPVSSEILALDEARRAKILAAETAQAEANKAAKEVGAAKARGDDAEFERLRTLVAETKSQIAALNEEAKAQDTALTDLLMGMSKFAGTGTLAISALPRLSITTSPRSVQGWILRQRRNSLAAALCCCLALLRACTARSRSSCWMYM